MNKLQIIVWNLKTSLQAKIEAILVTVHINQIQWFYNLFPTRPLISECIII